MKMPSRPKWLEDGFDFCGDGHVRGGETVDGEFLAFGFRELEEATDVVVLVVAGEEAFGFGGRKAEVGECNGFAEGSGVLQVEANEFAQGHEGSAASGFGADRLLLRLSVLRAESQGKRARLRRGLSATLRFGKMLNAI